jgi:hypothetical protein
MTNAATSPSCTRIITAKLRSARGRDTSHSTSSNDADGPCSPTQQGRMPRIARLMALAIRLDGMLQRGEVNSQRELAEVARVTPARLTQILNLLHLAPDIQEALLFLPPVVNGRDLVTERTLRPVGHFVSWHRQRQCPLNIQIHTEVENTLPRL